MNIWLIILGMAMVTFLPRVLPLVAINEEALPMWVRRGLAYVPIAVLSAIVGPAFIPSKTWLDFTLDGRLLAGLLAIAVAWYSQSTIATILAGMAMLLILT